MAAQSGVNDFRLPELLEVAPCPADAPVRAVSVFGPVTAGAPAERNAKDMARFSNAASGQNWKQLQEGLVRHQVKNTKGSNNH